MYRTYIFYRACGTFLPYSLYLHRLFQKAYGRAFFRTDRDVRGSTQKRRFVLCTNLVVRTPKDGRGISQKQVLEQNLSSTDVHGRTSVERYTDVHFWTGYFKRLTEEYALRYAAAENSPQRIKTAKDSRGDKQKPVFGKTR